MGPERRLGAARHGLAVLIASSLFPSAVAWAEGEMQLLLPIVSAMAFGVSAVEATHSARPASLVTPAPARKDGGLLPRRLHIPDGYEIDIERDPPRFASPVDRDRIVGFDVLQRPRRGMTASLNYDEEKRGPFPGSGEVIRFVVELRF